VQPRPVGQPRVDHRRGAVEAQTEGRDHALGDAHDRVGIEVARHRFEAPVPLDEDPARPVDHHFGHRRVGQQRLQRAEALHIGDHRIEHGRRRGFGHERRFVAE
jgi:hypothetical protein